MDNKMERVLTIRELAKVTGQSYWFWWKLAKAGKVPCIKTAGKILFRLSTVEHWLSEQEAASVVKDNDNADCGKIRRIY